MIFSSDFIPVKETVPKPGTQSNKKKKKKEIKMEETPVPIPEGVFFFL